MRSNYDTDRDTLAAEMYFLKENKCKDDSRDMYELSFHS